MGKTARLFHKIKRIFEKLSLLSPVLIRPTSDSITVSLSKRFLLFQLLNQLSQKIDEDPRLNFMGFLKTHKIFSTSLNGTVRDFYRDRDALYFTYFFTYKELHLRVKSDIERVYKINADVKVTIFKDGLVLYDNYKNRQFNILLLTCHSGSYLPENIEQKLFLTREQRYKEEDIASDEIYSELVLKQGGIWIDNKMSRYYCDLNRSMSKSIYKNRPKKNIMIWKQNLTDEEKENIRQYYRDFYFLLKKLLDIYKFNVIFDGHTMQDMKGRANISMGTHFIPKFYLPIVGSINKKIIYLGYKSVGINEPYGGGFILEWISTKYPNLFIFSMEVNKKLYMTKNRLKIKQKNVSALAEDMVDIFDIIEDKKYRLPENKYSKLNETL
ncbi:MAG: N-formylglutamate amidohydrolase [Nanoarchaeota archaeon]|nr:N-formylglutamate amidohydrolase [Nanoarchaeota archaeon]MBU4300216.1 N-formylglutamate amidohydrolase [Nanoarchaeota archaeon]MBU4451602.1 N-formylglutamate amidohydrolase [Nanoarchaeota archaeon]MCG2723124.1 N-formylglutamate amidohydrolase [archaeon]